MQTNTESKIVKIEDQIYFVNEDNRLINLESTKLFDPSRISGSDSKGTNLIRSFLIEQFIKFNGRIKVSYLMTMDCVISNILYAVTKRKIVRISLNKNDYLHLSKDRDLSHCSYRKIKAVIDFLVDHEYIGIKKGYLNRSSGESKMTRIWATEKLINEIIIHPTDNQESYDDYGGSFYDYEESCDYYGSIDKMDLVYDIETTNLAHENLVKLRKTVKISNKQKIIIPIDYEDSQETLRMKEMLREYNKLMEDHIVDLPASEYNEYLIDLGLNRLTYTKALYEISDYKPFRLINSNIENLYDDILEAKINYFRPFMNRKLIDDGRHYLTKKAITKYKIVNPDKMIPMQTSLYRVFSNESFNYNGRFFGADYQMLKKELRKSLLIDGENVVELDYKALHANMMYSINGIKYEGEDPYDLYNGNKVLRTAVKIMFNVAMNSSSKASAIKAFARKLHKKKHEKIEYQEILQELDSHKVSLVTLLESIVSAHPIFEEYLYSGMGLTFQNYDSRIASIILQSFTEREIPCLCIHDSFIVEEKYQKELYNQMLIAYDMVFPGHSCKIA
jgi:hypothetical protein